MRQNWANSPTPKPTRPASQPTAGGRLGSDTEFSAGIALISAIGIIANPFRLISFGRPSGRARDKTLRRSAVALPVVFAGIVLLATQTFAQQPGSALGPMPPAMPSVLPPNLPPNLAPPSEATPSGLPAPVMSASADVLPGFPQPPEQPGSLLMPSSPTFICEALPAPYFDCDPRLDPPVLPQPGWLADVEVGILLPHVRNEMHDTVTVSGVTSRVQLPSARLDWTGAPRVELGYRLPEGFGEIDLAYRFLGSQGTGTVTGPFAAPDGPATLSSRLDIQVADLDYASNELSICCWWMKWRLGLRGADVYFDSRAEESLAAAGGGSGIFERRVTNNFWGIGPHGSLELERRLNDWGLTLTGRLDSAILLGRVNQGFFEESTTPGVSGQTLRSNAGAVPQINASLGVAWRPPHCQALRLFAGYSYEYWWNVGRFADQGPQGEVYDQGVLLRADFNY